MLRPIFTYTVLALSLNLPTAFGCDIPVFRYALDRWPADTFQLEAPADVLRTEPLATEFRNLTDSSGLNLQTTVSSNGCRLFFPAHVRNATTPLWSGELAPKIYQSLTDSPARQELAKRILAGDSAVWVLVESGKTETDDALAKLFTKRLRFLESAIGLPPLDPNDPSSQLGPGPELRVKLSLLRVKRSDANEAAFLAMLAGPKGLSAFSENEPFVAVVFGRGRVLGSWPYKKVSEEFIEEATRFLINSCSCEVKNENPGWDLLMRVDWDTELKKMARGSSRKVEQKNIQETVVFTPKNEKNGRQKTDDKK